MTKAPSPSGSKSAIVQLAERTSNVCSRGYGALLFPTDPSYPEGLPRPGNGTGALRADPRSSLAQCYRILKIHANGEIYVVEDGQHRSLPWVEDMDNPKVKSLIAATNGRRLIAWRLYGFANPQTSSFPRPSKLLRKAIVKSRCAFDGFSKADEVDFKYGRRDQAGYPQGDPSDKPSLYQPVSKHAHKVKKSACDECRRSNIRPGVSHMGFPVDYTEGNATFDPTGPGCRGCYLFDPAAFRETVSKSADDIAVDVIEDLSAA